MAARLSARKEGFSSSKRLVHPRSMSLAPPMSMAAACACACDSLSRPSFVWPVAASASAMRVNAPAHAWASRIFAAGLRDRSNTRLAVGRSTQTPGHRCVGGHLGGRFPHRECVRTCDDRQDCGRGSTRHGLAPGETPSHQSAFARCFLSDSPPSGTLRRFPKTARVPPRFGYSRIREHRTRLLIGAGGVGYNPAFARDGGAPHGRVPNPSPGVAESA